MKMIQILKLTVLSGSLLAAATLHAATLTAVPMQGGMIMPMLRYDAALEQVQVMMTNTVPTLTPLLISNPGDSFAPADPWFNALDPSAQGASFSRRYGFMWNSAMSASLPANTQVWIRQLSSSPGLNVYRYNGSVPQVFDPIFGTGGTTNARAWNLMMFHPCFTAAPGTNTFAAQFEAYLVDTTTGLEVPNSSTGAFTFNFNNLADGRPALSLAPMMVVSWPVETGTNWVLECAAGASATEWLPVTNAPVELDGQSAIVLDNSAGQQFFRLRHVP